MGMWPSFIGLFSKRNFSYTSKKIFNLNSYGLPEPHRHLQALLKNSGQTGTKPADSLEKEHNSSLVTPTVCCYQENANLPAFTFSGLEH